MKPPRICKKCSGIVLAGRCPCVSVRPRYRRAAQGSVEAAHFYQLIKSIRSGSWADTGYRAPYSAGRMAMKNLHDAMDKAFSIRRRSTARHFDSLTAIQFFVYRCEIAHTYWRNEFYGLIATRLTLWLGGLPKKDVCDLLQIPRAELAWLDGEIRRHIRFGRPAYRHPDYLRARRKMKAGVALDIIRRRKHGYKQGQVLQPQQYNSPF